MYKLYIIVEKIAIITFIIVTQKNKQKHLASTHLEINYKF